MTKQEIIAAATAKAPSTDTTTAHVSVGRDDLLAALKGCTNERAKALAVGAENSGKNSLLFIQREQLLEALANEPAKVH